MERQERCPKCGGTSGFTAKDYFAGWATQHGRWDLSDGDYPCFGETVGVKRYSKTCICLDCGARVKRPDYEA